MKTSTKQEFKEVTDIEMFKLSLKNKIGYVEFTKRNGDLRKMYFTLNKDIISQNDETPTGTGKVSKSTDQIKVLEVDEKDLYTSLGWKTINLKTVIVFKVLS